MPFRVLGVSDDRTECDRCGKTNLRRTVALSPLDADGNDTGEVVYYGVDCAGQALRGKKSKANSDVVERQGLAMTQAQRWIKNGIDLKKVADGIWNKYGYSTLIKNGKLFIQLEQGKLIPVECGSRVCTRHAYDECPDCFRSSYEQTESFAGRLLRDLQEKAELPEPYRVAQFDMRFDNFGGPGADRLWQMLRYGGFSAHYFALHLADRNLQARTIKRTGVARLEVTLDWQDAMATDKELREWVGETFYAFEFSYGIIGHVDPKTIRVMSPEQVTDVEPHPIFKTKGARP